MTAARRALGVRPVFKRIDTCAAEFASPTAYMYSTYEAPFAGVPADEARPSDRQKVVILGGGPNRIGQGIEFDYCCCHAAFALQEAGYETIMVNCNPETVSTDYDTSDRLYFEPLTAEDVIEIIDTERQQRHAARRDRAVRRPDPAQARRGAGAGATCRSSAPRPTPSTSPRIATASSSCSTSSASSSRATASPIRSSRRGWWRPSSAFRWWSARPTCWAAAPCRSSARRSSSRDYLLGTLPELVPHDVKARYPNDKTGQINTVLGKNPLLFDRYLSRRHRGRRRLPRRRPATPSSPASWSTSRRPASIPAIPPARCRRTISSRRRSPSSSARRASSRWRSRSAD